MTEKLAAIQRMKDLMKEHNLKYVYLKQVIHTTHPGFEWENVIIMGLSEGNFPNM